MFRCRDDKCEEIIDAILEILSQSKIDDIYVPHILANILYKYDFGLDHLYYEWLSDNYFICYLPKIIENIKFIQEHLVKNGHTVRNRGGHGCGDSYVYYIPTPKMIFQCYEDQNVKFVCLYKKNDFVENLHIRRVWDRAGNNKYRKKPTIKSFRKIFNRTSLVGEFPLRYGDSRDSGYILSYDSFIRGINGSSYSQGLIRHAFFNIKSQADNFKDEEN